LSYGELEGLYLFGGGHGVVPYRQQTFTKLEALGDRGIHHHYTMTTMMNIGQQEEGAAK